MKAIILHSGLNNHFRLGKQSLTDTYSYIYSDTLFSAIVSTYSIMYGREETNKLIEQIVQKREIQFSSGFHCLELPEDEGYIYFLPKPISYQLPTVASLKKLKKIEFISCDVWKQSPSPEELLCFPRFYGKHVISWEEYYKLQLGFSHLILDRREKYKLAVDINYPKVHVRKEGQEDAYYTQTCLQLKHFKNIKGQAIRTHYYFLLEGENFSKRLLAAIRLLADEGIGGERSTGAGYFQEIKDLDWEFQGSEDATHACTLSLSIPESKEAFSAYEYYTLKLRGGGSMASENSLVNTHYRKQLRMISEGAMIPLTREIPRGTCPEIAPNRLRYGIPITLPFRYHG